MEHVRAFVRARIYSVCTKCRCVKSVTTCVSAANMDGGSEPLSELRDVTVSTIQATTGDRQIPRMRRVAAEVVPGPLGGATAN